MENILSVDLSSSTSPVVEEVRGKDWIEYGTEEWANLYPQFLIDLYNNSSTHSAIINTTAGMISGNDIIIDEDGKEENVDRYVKLQNFFNYANGKETLHEVLQKVALDFKLQGAFALHLIWNKAKTEIVEIHHVPCERVRAGIPNALGVVDTYYVSADWSDTRDNIPTPIAAFNSNDRTGASQLLYSGLYSPNMDVYHTPDYLAANNWALIDQKVAEYMNNTISNGFSGSYMINFANGVPTQEERISLERNLAAKFSGSSNAGKMVITFSDDKTRTPDVIPITVSNQDKQYLALQELLVQNILTGHRVVSPLLFGIKSDGSGLGSNVDELNAAFEVFLNTVVKGFQVKILRVLAKIFKINDMDMPISFVQAKPITTQFTIDDMRSVMTQEEIREELGLAPLEQDEVVEEDDFDKIGMIDGKPVYNTKEEAIANAERLGCSGYHVHEYEGNTVYMACESHDELMNFGKTELQSFLDTMEDIPEDWELVEEEKVEDEHEDFDFEQSLNEFANDKTELASTGIARPNAKTKGKNNQDGVNKSFNDYYKVRYVYAKDNFLSQEGETRDFCKLMTSAKKIYRKQDIINMGSKPVNAGWGAKGAATYSIWFYKGGGNCHHYWLRQIYKTSLTNAKSNISSSQLIGYTKAKSEGFTAQKNNNKVAKAPKRMKNNGFLKPR